MNLTRAIEPWTIQPLERFVNESQARLTLLMTPAGQVLAQHGFTRAIDVMSAATLGAAILSSSGEIARMLSDAPFSSLNHHGKNYGIFLASLDLPREPLLLLVVYGTDSSVGLVQLFFEDLVHDLAAACPPPETKKLVLAADFERELNESLAALFGR
jgi:hypothetical protein